MSIVVRPATQARFGDVATMLGPKNPDSSDLRTIQGVAGRKLVETATEARAELVVLATRGSVSSLPGAVSQYTMRRARCPVLVVPEADTARGSGNH
jgi:nucleotide-binding universal stress UspA family protein